VIAITTGIREGPESPHDMTFLDRHPTSLESRAELRARCSLFTLFLISFGALSALAQDASTAIMPVYEGNVVRVTPETGLQGALDTASPGDVITLAPGVYYESAVLDRSGTAEAPIVIVAEEPGTATISGATTPDFELGFTRVEGDLHRANVPWTVRWVMVDGRNLMGYDDLQGLRSFTILGHDSGSVVDGPPEGFVWVDGTLYVRLLGGQDPNRANLEIHRSFNAAETPLLNTDYFGDRAWPSRRDLPLDDPSGANLTIRGSHVVVAGLKLHLGPLSAINVAADDVTIHDCHVDGAWRSIRAGDSDRVRVAYSEFSGYPAYQWVRWGYENGKQWDLWNAIYNSNLNINHVHHYGRSFELEHSLIYECFDCLWPRNMGSLDPNDQSEYRHNLVMSCGDECIEFDTREAINLRVHHSFLMDATAVLALSPVQGGGLTIDHNIVYSSPEYGLGSSVLLKFQCPWCSTGSPSTKDVTIAHNTLVSSTGGLYWTGEEHTYEDSIFENNVVYTRRETGWVHADFTMSPYNLHSGPRMDPDARNMSHVIHAADPDLVSAPLMGAGALVDGVRQPLPVLPLQTEPPLSESPPVDFRLAGGGVSVDAGNPATYLDDRYHHRRSGSEPDLGAIELGENWGFSAGPRWATGSKTPWRPTPPPSLDPIWIGLAEPVPEPGSTALCLAGIAGLVGLARRRRLDRRSGWVIHPDRTSPEASGRRSGSRATRP